MKSSNILIINYKNYEEIAGSKGVELARIAEDISNELDKEVILSPPHCLLTYIAEKVNLKVFAQHLDNVIKGSTTGFIVPEIAYGSMIKGSLINHSEHRIARNDIKALVERLRTLGMISVVCARTAEEVKEFSLFKPDYIAIEPPELIGSGVAVSKAKPEIIRDSIAAANGIKVICGAGIVDGSDVSAALDLGSEGVLIASGIIKAKDWKGKIREIVERL
ncbi:MAG: triose-phosphate isomerase [Candidatus Nitrosocaldaceae archaeon]